MAVALAHPPARRALWWLVCLAALVAAPGLEVDLRRWISRMHASKLYGGGLEEMVKDYRVVVVMTTIPPRIERIEPVLDAMLAQTWPLDKLYLSIPHTYNRTGEPYVIPDWLRSKSGVHIARCEDMGPGTHLLNGLRLEQDPWAFIVVVDDDHIYSPDLVETLMRAALAHPGNAVAAQGFLSVPGLEITKDSPRYLHDQGFASGPVLVSYLGVVYQRGFFDDTVFDYSLAAEQCKYQDDMWFSAHLALKGIGRVVLGSALGVQELRDMHLGPESLTHWKENKPREVSAKCNDSLLRRASAIWACRSRLVLSLGGLPPRPSDAAGSDAAEVGEWQSALRARRPLGASFWLGGVLVMDSDACPASPAEPGVGQLLRDPLRWEGDPSTVVLLGALEDVVSQGADLAALAECAASRVPSGCGQGEAGPVDSAGNGAGAAANAGRDSANAAVAGSPFCRIGELAAVTDDILGCTSCDKNVYLWKHTTGELLKKLTGHSNEVNGIDFHCTQQVMASASDDKSCLIWDFAEAIQLRTLDKHTEAVYGCKFLGQEMQFNIATCCFDRSTRIFDMRDKSVSACLQLHNDDVIGGAGTRYIEPRDSRRDGGARPRLNPSPRFAGGTAASEMQRPGGGPIAQMRPSGDVSRLLDPSIRLAGGRVIAPLGFARTSALSAPGGAGRRRAQKRGGAAGDWTLGIVSGLPNWATGLAGSALSGAERALSSRGEGESPGAIGRREPVSGVARASPVRPPTSAWFMRPAIRVSVPRPLDERRIVGRPPGNPAAALARCRSSPVALAPLLKVSVPKRTGQAPTPLRPHSWERLLRSTARCRSNVAVDSDAVGRAGVTSGGVRVLERLVQCASDSRQTRRTLTSDAGTNMRREHHGREARAPGAALPGGGAGEWPVPPGASLAARHDRGAEAAALAPAAPAVPAPEARELLRGIEARCEGLLELQERHQRLEARRQEAEAAHLRAVTDALAGGRRGQDAVAARFHALDAEANAAHSGVLALRDGQIDSLQRLCAAERAELWRLRSAAGDALAREVDRLRARRAALEAELAGRGGGAEAPSGALPSEEQRQGTAAPAAAASAGAPGAAGKGQGSLRARVEDLCGRLADAEVQLSRQALRRASLDRLAESLVLGCRCAEPPGPLRSHSAAALPGGWGAQAPRAASPERHPGSAAPPAAESGQRPRLPGSSAAGRLPARDSADARGSPGAAARCGSEAPGGPPPAWRALEARQAASPPRLGGGELACGPPNSGEAYGPCPGDSVDEEVAHFVNRPRNRLRRSLLRRQGPGQYLYGASQVRVRRRAGAGGGLEASAVALGSDWTPIEELLRWLERLQSRAPRHAPRRVLVAPPWDRGPHAAGGGCAEARKNCRHPSEARA
ncbi:unnamed protein product [Prorocentrum cordatum]|uniref:GAR domain-containing protein n=1 Tax=Prorocentrum cordatum TaxID=2364126 RepID=A0ABN9S9V8_9DINO|nr:unnamed protein product [Polarella glacialis]